MKKLLLLVPILLLLAAACNSQTANNSTPNDTPVAQQPAPTSSNPPLTPTPGQNPAPVPIPAPKPQPKPNPTPVPAPAPSTKSFTVTGSDNQADLTNITVNKGDMVMLTFKVDPNNTYHGGLDFRSSVVNSGTIAPGASKMVMFTAASSFSFIPYWPASNIRKPYTININVQ